MSKCKWCYDSLVEGLEFCNEVCKVDWEQNEIEVQERNDWYARVESSSATPQDAADFLKKERYSIPPKLREKLIVWLEKLESINLQALLEDSDD